MASQTQKNPVIAVVLSALLCGLGQMYNGQIGKGILFAVIQFINVLLFMVFIGYVTYLIFWIYNMIDAYKQAEKRNENHTM
ncbi:hypothetical protein D7Z54_17005 [Salibacterium salarium]|uniref:TM2 domain-containing protein n=1 Tax=Salibacterium salarium TaxID=284579 RepID=A0A428N194_9BACI|nr:hypothetical protein [Salibacterium salarium]RSL32126.1 hypothetical protein D7Z54_17005 [Salibacterium salarium]